MEKPLAAGIILINRAKQVLLILRDDIPSIPFPNHWDIPGGHLMVGESPEACVRREMIEEMELELGEIQLFKEYDRDDLHEFIYWKQIDLEPSRIKLHEGQKAQYFTLEEINTMRLAFRYNEVIKEFRNLVVKPP
ncbi:MAG: NUDIX domain-containing protein [Bacteroidota bacterium]